MPHRRTFAAALLATGLVALALGAVAGAFRGHRVFVAWNVCTGHATRPHRIILACGDAAFEATRVSWRSYGGRTAATRTVRLRTRSVFSQGRLTLSRVVRCSDRRWYYSRAHYVYTRNKPRGVPRSGVANIQPFLRCARVAGG